MEFLTQCVSRSLCFKYFLYSAPLGTVGESTTIEVFSEIFCVFPLSPQVAGQQLPGLQGVPFHAYLLKQGLPTVAGIMNDMFPEGLDQYTCQVLESGLMPSILGG